MFSDPRHWSLAFFDAPMDQAKPWIAGAYLANEQFFCEAAPIRRYFSPAPRLRRGVGPIGLDEPGPFHAALSFLIGQVTPVRFGPALYNPEVTLVEGPMVFDIREPDRPIFLPVGQIAKESGLTFYRLGCSPRRIVFRATLPSGHSRLVHLWKEGGAPGWQRHETGKPLADERGDDFGAPMRAAPDADRSLQALLDRIAPGLAPDAEIDEENAVWIGQSFHGETLEPFAEEAQRLRSGKGLGLVPY